ncbi:MAG: epoxyqueuosine reductase QueH [Actinobacteria bacterium]|nr:epoxyqueuosine reductase QueH [Actinomycetota bacterium]
MKLLLHICCGPCAGATIPHWQEKEVEVVGFWFNPNVHPLLEYRRRLTGTEEVCEITDVKSVVDESYDPAGWFALVTGTEESRCSRCIGHRLERTAQEAVSQGCDAFSTTLSISPWQDHEAIQAQGALAAERHGVEFVYEDLRPLYPESRRLSREWGLYRQKYCGCLVSEWERYRGS